MSNDLRRFDHTSDPRFLEYYSRESQSEETVARFSRIMERVLGIFAESGSPPRVLDVIDIGCGAGTQALLWARAGHSVRAIDINGPLVTVGSQRASGEELLVRFVVGSATQLPFESTSADVVLLPELLEHVADWESSLEEAVRVLRPGGLLYVSTSNRLCPRQQEFNLRLYSWYPSFIKKWCEHKAVTTHPEWANHARYPAVNWFTYYELRDWLAMRGLTAQDRFDVLARRPLPPMKKMLAALVVRAPPLRFLGHVATEGTTVWARKGD